MGAMHHQPENHIGQKTNQQNGPEEGRDLRRPLGLVEQDQRGGNRARPGQHRHSQGRDGDVLLGRALGDLFLRFVRGGAPRVKHIQAMRRSRMLPASWKAGRVMPMTLKIILPVAAKRMSTPAATEQASRAVRNLAAGESLGVMAMKAGTTAMGSSTAKSELNASKLNSVKRIYS